MRVYISGVVHSVDGCHEQEYRDRIGAELRKRYRDVHIASPESDRITCGVAGEEERLFFRQIEQALMADLVIAYLPTASMGSAIEIWEAYKNSRPVIIISPLESNWTVRFLSARIFPDLETFLDFAASGGLDRTLLDRYSPAGWA